MRHLILCLALPLLCSVTSHAQSYAITGTVSGGGGVSSGTGAAGTFSVTSTIAQQAWNASTGSPYAVSGGFFSQYEALQTLGAPPLVIRRNGTNVELVWGSNVPGWVLQWNSGDLAPASWLDVVGTPSVNGTEQFIQFAAGSGRVFFRLRKL